MTRESMPRWLLAALCIGAAVIAAPFAGWIVFAVWLGRYARKLHAPIMRGLGGRRGLSASVTVGLMMLVFVPIAALLTSVVIDAIALVQQLMASTTGKAVLVQLAGGDKPGAEITQHAISTADIVDLLRTQGERAWSIATQIAGATASGVIGMLVLVTGIYGILVEGERWFAWIEKHSPLAPASTHRLADAFVETGRGLAYGIVGAGLVQATVATIAFLVIGVPSALALGLLTLLFSVIPAVGTAIVWVPVAIGLALTGRTGAAIALAIIGVAVIGTIDNLARPFLARRGQLALPSFVLLIAMFGGVELIGGWGLVLGPLVIRLAKEAVAIRAEPGFVITPGSP
jgi:predicted PurR-regulated permease PerM